MPANHQGKSTEPSIRPLLETLGQLHTRDTVSEKRIKGEHRSVGALAALATPNPWIQCQLMSVGQRIISSSLAHHRVPHR